ncbi:SHOCT domain-containing protein [Natrinema sp. 1APR25-10V2]|uniref:SHOCT domain-containing protein n=1 Tax=Natrinema sp. 1APR25-10V2 TaxID=2951081 RepID=UPI002875FC69|nr:SHOCT domain-containing protein [Natrinema sp. 1APR25-10V2]MDS0478145.1 SHOCT domain-containing protein [Natrinema sp. 1APR25-10V2]
MTKPTTHLGRTARRLALLSVPLLVAATGTAAAHGGGMMGGLGGFGMLGGGMFLWPLLLIGLVLLLMYGTNREESASGPDTALAELRERYARGELSDEEFENRRSSLTQ